MTRRLGSSMVQAGLPCCCVLCLLLLSLYGQAVDPDRFSSHQMQAVPSNQPSLEAPSCAVTQARDDCGYFGIQQAECQSRSCCWQPVNDASGNTPWCYYPQQPGAATYTVAKRTDTDTGSDLQLELKQPVLPKFGPDFNQLVVKAKHETPYRLHVSIKTAGIQRWEVPEWLIPRPSSIPFDPAEATYALELPSEGAPFAFAIARTGPQLQEHLQQQNHQQQGSQEPPWQQRPIFNTSGFSLVFKEQYMELTTSISAATEVYGPGETNHPTGQLKVPRNGRTITLWNYDISSSSTNINLYGSHPFYLQVDEDGLSSGVFLLNSNGMDMVFDEISITYRVIGGVFDFYFFMGPGPEDVIQQYQEVIGKPAMPPLWALGLHQCRWGYHTLSQVQEVVAGYRNANIPLEVIWTDIDLFDRYRDFTFDQDRFKASSMRVYIEELHAGGQHWIPITDCGIPHAPDDPAFTSGMQQDVFIRDVTGQPYLGQVWPGATHYPDFLSVNQTWPWWKQQLQGMHDKVPYSGMWIDMNEASNFCDGEICKLSPITAAIEAATTAAANAASTGDTAAQRTGLWLMEQLWLYAVKALSIFSPHIQTASDQQQVATSAAFANCDLDCTQPSQQDSLSHPPYAVNNLQNHVHLGSKTLPMSATHINGEQEYDVHNLYGLAEAAATKAAVEQITGKRAFVLSRSTFAGSGHHAAHWTGDNAANWDNLLWSVSGLLNSNIWGIAMAGADICGFQDDTTEELCARWISAGAFYTFTRNHNSINSAPQELYRWPAVAAAARKALGMRYRLLPYLYTCFYKAHTEGGTVARPLFFAFPAAAQARETYKQWMLGDSILVSPVLEAGSTQVQAYLPEASWYSLWDYSHTKGPITATVNVPLTDIPVHVRGGSIIAMQQPLNTTAQVARSPVKLVVALDQHQVGPQQGPHQAAEQQGAGIHIDADTPAACGKGHQQHDAGAAADAGATDRKCTSSLSSTSCSNSGSSSKSDGTPTNSDNKPSQCAAGGCLHSRPGPLLGCGLLYMDDGDSIAVPAEQGASLVYFSSLVQSDTVQGWLTSTPADPTADSDMAKCLQDVYNSCRRVLRSDSSSHMLHDSISLQGKRCYQSTTARSSSKSRKKAEKNQSSMLNDLPSVAEVVVLGVPPAAAAADTQAAAGYVVSLDGQRIPQDQVTYDADVQVLAVKGLQQPLSDAFQLEWQAQQAAV